MDTKQFLLMHKNIPVIALSLDTITGNILASDIIDKKYAPIGYNNPRVFANWWERRAIPKHQLNTEVLLGNNTNMEYMMKNLGLSLVDTYWINPIDSAYTWEDVNLYNHNFAEKDFNFSDLDNVSPFKPSATTQGELQKRWIIKNNERYLVKGNYGTMFRQSLNEIFVSDVHEMQGVDYTNYEAFSLPTTMGEGIGCISKNFTNENLEFIPAYDITFYSKQPNDESVLEYYINTCASLGINKKAMQNHIDYMILSDFLFTNTDRHFLNLGILRDSETLKFVKPAPYFDTGNSMFYNMQYNPKTIFDIKTTSFYKTELKMISQVKNRNALDLSKIPDATELSKWYKCDPYSIVYLDNLKKGYDKKIEMLNAFQKGYSVNPRSKNFYANIPNKLEKSLESAEKEIPNERDEV